MKKIALFLFGFGSLVALSVNAANYSSSEATPQYQEQSAPVCVNDTCTQLPCNTPVNCPVDTVCAPVCNPAPVCAPGC